MISVSPRDFYLIHGNESKYSSTERGAETGQGFLCFLKPVLHVKAQDATMHKGKMTELLLH